MDRLGVGEERVYMDEQLPTFENLFNQIGRTIFAHEPGENGQWYYFILDDPYDPAYDTWVWDNIVYPYALEMDRGRQIFRAKLLYVEKREKITVKNGRLVLQHG